MNIYHPTPYRLGQVLNVYTELFIDSLGNASAVTYCDWLPNPTKKDKKPKMKFRHLLYIKRIPR